MSAVVVVDKVTGEALRRYGSMAEAADAEGVSRSMVRMHCVERRQGRGRYCFRFEEGRDPREEFGSRVGRPVALVDWDGVAYVADSLADAARWAHVDHSRASRAACGEELLAGRYRVVVLGRMGQIGKGGAR